MNGKRTGIPRRRVLTALMLATLLTPCLLPGCSNSSGPSIADPEPPEYSTRLTPEDVMANLRKAYVFMDLEPYLDCLSEDFVFYPTQDDVQNPNNQIPAEWYKAEERLMHSQMFDDGSNVESISLTLTTMTSEHEEGNPQDPLDDIYVYREGVDLRINLIHGLTFLATAPSEFRLRVDQDEDGPNGEILWEIYQWFDDPVRDGTGERGEDATWGGIKAAYR
jgi:hypothetical protein